MISAFQIVEELIKQKPFLEEALAEDIINYSSLARQLRPQIEKRLLKQVKEGAIIMALKRASLKLKETLSKSDEIWRSLGDIVIRSNLVDYTFVNSPTLAGALDKIHRVTADRKDVFITISHGASQVSIIASESLENEMKEIFKDETPLCTIENLSSLTIRISIEATKIPGVLYSILKVLAWEGISITECVSTFTELSIVLDHKDIDRAFSTIKNKTEKNHGKD